MQYIIKCLDWLIYISEFYRWNTDENWHRLDYTDLPRRTNVNTDLNPSDIINVDWDTD